MCRHSMYYSRRLVSFWDCESHFIFSPSPPHQTIKIHFNFHLLCHSWSGTVTSSWCVTSKTLPSHSIYRIFHCGKRNTHPPPFYHIKLHGMFVCECVVVVMRDRMWCGSHTNRESDRDSLIYCAPPSRVLLRFDCVELLKNIAVWVDACVLLLGSF